MCNEKGRRSGIIPTSEASFILFLQTDKLPVPAQNQSANLQCS